MRIIPAGTYLRYTTEWDELYLKLEQEYPLPCTNNVKVTYFDTAYQKMIVGYISEEHRQYLRFIDDQELVMLRLSDVIKS